MSTAVSNEEMFAKALNHERAGELIDAFKTYKGIIEKDASYRPALFNLGSLCSRVGEFDEALVWLRKSSAIKEDHLVWFNIGSVLYRKGDYQESVIALEKSRRMKKDFVLPVLVMGLSYSKAGKHTSAAGCFAEVLTIDPENQVALTALAILHYEKKKYNLALHYAEAALRRNGDNLSIRKLRSKILLSFGRTSESTEEFQKIIREDKAFKRFDVFMKKVPKDALADGHGTIEEKISLYQTNIDKAAPKDMVALSLLYLLKGDPDSAIDYLFKAKG
jgi:tetratricopeptide (TPR) repeat protein